MHDPGALFLKCTRYDSERTCDGIRRFTDSGRDCRHNAGVRADGQLQRVALPKAASGKATVADEIRGDGQARGLTATTIPVCLVEPLAFPVIESDFLINSDGDAGVQIVTVKLGVARFRVVQIA